MDVRSRGSLLAGTAALAGLIAAGLGCHSSPSDHDAFSIPKTPRQNINLLSQRADTAMPAAYPTQPVGYSAQPVLQYDPAPAAARNAFPLTPQPVPIIQSSNKREVIASSWSPVQRVSAEQPVTGPDLQEGTPSAPVDPAHVPAHLPIGMPMQVNNGPLLDGDDAAAPPGNIVLPQPRPLGSPSSAPIVVNGALPPGPSPRHQSVPREFEKMTLPPYVVEPPDILLIQASNRITLRLQPIQGSHLVGPDGTVNLGIYGKIRVAGLTLDQVGDAVAARLLEIMPGLLRGLKATDKEGKDDPKGADLQQEFRHDFTSLELIKKEMQVDVLTYNSKFYYVITDGGGYGQQIYPIPIRGNETVLDALANINGLPAVASKKRVWVARATRAGQPPKIMPVDWMAVTKCGQSATNYQLFPGDRVYVDSNNLIKADTFLSKLYSPILRTFGVTLLGASTVNTIKFGASSGGGFGGLGLIR
ncbi:MAG: polysaccharide biosynthesis/export family protein [Gemmataceae bacterium]